MPRALWTAISILLLIHVLMMVGFLLWLGSSERLDGERIGRIRQMLSLTIQEEQAQQEQAQALEEEAQKQAADLARLESVSDGPISLADRLAAQQEKDEIALLRLDRLQKDIRNLQGQLELTKRQLAQEREGLQTQQKAFEQAVEERAQLDTDENFQQTVQMYEKLKPKQVKQMFQDLLNQGQTDQVIDYLAAMQLRKASAALKEFKSPREISQATDLLQRLRERGVDPQQLGL